MKIARRKKRGRSRWTVDYEDWAGRRVQKLFSSREAAEEYAAKATLKALTKATPTLAPETTYGEFSMRVIGEREPVIKARTVESYRETNRLHLLPEFGATPIRDLVRTNIKSFLVGKLNHFSRNTVRLMYATLHVVLGEAVEAELIPANPIAGLAKKLKLSQKMNARQADVKAKAFSRTQRELFLARATQIEAWWAPMWKVQTLTGLRPGEIYAIEERDIDFKYLTLHVERALSDDGARIETPKGNRSRDIDLTPKAAAVLQTQIAHRKAQKLERGWREMPKTLFCSKAGTYADPSNVRAAFRRVLNKAELPSHFTPHGLRHTYASLLLAEGVDVYYVSDQLGHASIELTVSTYGAWLKPKRRAGLDTLDDADDAASNVLS
jgi:integrase